MGRIRDAYEAKFRTMLQKFAPARRELGVQLLLERAERLSARKAVPLPQALAEVYHRASRQFARGQPDPNPPATEPAATPASPATDAPLFVCDAGLGGLARWLRAAGYEAQWQPDIDDDDLIRSARTLAATMLTTDSLLMERGVLRDGLIPALWVPPSMKKFEQLCFVLRELALPVRPPRCMSCGGALRRVDKEALRDRIPPKTYIWRDDYFVCSRCDKLFWKGTHWDRIGDRLRHITSPR